MASETENPAPSPVKRRWLLNLLLIAVVAGLAIIVAYTQLAGPKMPPPTLTALRSPDVTRIELAHKGRSTIVLAREESNRGDTEGKWRMQEPLPARTNPFNVQALLSLAGASTVSELPFVPERLAAYGLDNPPTTVRFNDTTVFFGGTHPFQDQVYARHADRVFLVSAQQFRVATYAYSSFIDTQLLEPDRRISAFDLPGFRLRRHDGAWQREPALPELSADRIASFVDQWRHARALAVERSHGGRAISRVVLHADGGKALTIEVLAEQPELVLYRMDEGLAYHFPAAVGAQLLTLAPPKAD